MRGRQDAAIGVVLRIDVVGDEPAGPQHRAPVLAADGEAADGTDKGADAGNGADSDGSGGAGWSGPVIAAVVGGTGALLAAPAGLYGRARRSRAIDGTTRGGK
ncbi:hypothetical protein [Streptomyces sp. H27-D2]|uniref:hypothetical protein n=1 Tax=Streptomyces sp. H27-D2 TaxID=3046304 RepID=UPI002DBA6468|nr:hypothetical protein [Streptomyces sp. H27-D2]MEC4015726.1 hypothetical protein [Streptomyces sp. H27-D2]